MSELVSQLNDFIYEIGVDSFNKHCFVDSTEAKPIEQSQKIVYDYYTAFILLSCSDFKTIYKVHFNTIKGSEVLNGVMKKDKDQIKKEQILDFFKELCNVTIGAVKKKLIDADIDAGISLPFLSRGFDELFFLPKHEVFEHGEKYWEQTIFEQKLFFNCYTEIFSSNKLEKINFTELSQIEEEDEDLDFL